MSEIDFNKPGQSRFWKLRNDARAVEVPSRWPLPRIGGRNPVASAVPDSPRKSVDIGYPGLDFGVELFVPVYAVQRGDIAFAGETQSGFAITIDHGSWSSHYAHLSKMFVMPNLSRTRRLQHVRPGEVIGYAAKNPLHVRFEIWERTLTQGSEPVDPHERLATWLVESPIDLLRAPSVPAEAA
jgi:murein DD-endopeptidase MepM/ murein hydrolase activator NlpD